MNTNFIDFFNFVFPCMDPSFYSLMLLDVRWWILLDLFVNPDHGGPLGICFFILVYAFANPVKGTFT